MKGITFVKAFFKFIHYFFISVLSRYFYFVIFDSYILFFVSCGTLSSKSLMNYKDKISPCQIYFSRIFFKIVQAKKVPDINFLKAFDFIEYYREFCIVYAPLCVFFALFIDIRCHIFSSDSSELFIYLSQFLLCFY